jgi:hypothetical protein
MAFPAEHSVRNGISGVQSTQSKVKKTKVKENKHQSTEPAGVRGHAAALDFHIKSGFPYAPPTTATKSSASPRRGDL